MTNQNFIPNDDSESIDANTGQYSRRGRMRRTRTGGWVGGAILIGLGLLLMLQNLGISPIIENWWALFILIPAVGAFARAWSAYQSAGGRITAQARASFLGGLILTMIAAIFLLELNWIILGPVLLILAGAGLLLNAMLPG